MSPKRFQNPLLSDARLREMYLAMLEARALGKMTRRSALQKGLEASYVGSAIGLRDTEGDLASASSQTGTPLDLILGLPWRKALKGAQAPSRLNSHAPNPAARLWFALGATSALKPKKNIALLYANTAELSPADWKSILTEALRLELPAVFVVLPARGNPAPNPAPNQDVGVAELSSKLGVPGIPVDAADAVAIYRVAQESIGRARAGGGPALIEAIPFPASGDPIALLGKQLIAKRVATERWTRTIQAKTQARLERLTKRTT